MEVTTAIREDDGKTQVTVELTADEVKGYVDAFFKDLAKNRIPGFRPGKAPRKVLEQNFGGHESVYAQITTDAVNDVAPRAVDQEDIIVISDTDFDELGIFEDGKPFTFSFAAETKPVVELSSVEPVAITMPPSEVTDAEIDAQITALQDYYYSFDNVDDRAAQEGDFAMVALECTANDEKVEGLNSPSRMIELGGGTLPESLTGQIVGMEIGETKEFDFDAGDDAEFAYLEGAPVHAKVTLSELRAKVVPELDDEFAQQVGFDTMDELREELSGQIAQAKFSQLPDLKERRCVGALAERVEGDIPESYIQYCREDILRDFFNNLTEQGVSFDQFLQQRNITADDFQKDLDEQAKENATQGLALDALAAALELEVTEEDIDKEFAVVDDPQGTRKMWEEQGRMAFLREALLRTKAVNWLIDNADVTEEDASGEEDAD